MDMAEGGTKTAKYKNEEFTKIDHPNTRGNFLTIIGIFGLYSQFLPLYEMDT